VLGYLQTGFANAGTEATNRTVKTAARTAYGFTSTTSAAEYGSPAPDDHVGSPPPEDASPPSSSKSR